MPRPTPNAKRKQAARRQQRQRGAETGGGRRAGQAKRAPASDTARRGAKRHEAPERVRGKAARLDAAGDDDDDISSRGSSSGADDDAVEKRAAGAGEAGASDDDEIGATAEHFVDDAVDDDDDDDDDDGDGGEAVARSKAYLEHFEQSMASAPALRGLQAIDARVLQWSSALRVTATPGARVDAPGDAELAQLVAPARFEELHVRARLAPQWPAGRWSVLQSRLARPMFAYRDVAYMCRQQSESAELRALMALHAVNHVFQVRDSVLSHNKKLRAAAAGAKSSKAAKALEFRDQGFSRATVLVLLPNRGAAHRFVTELIGLLPKEQARSVHNLQRFEEEFGFDSEPTPGMLRKPKDFQEVFCCNNDDCFRVGVSFTRKAARLYSEFYRSDIIVASPLGLKLVTGEEGDRDRHFDFLSSIEIVMIDYADVLLMQNWQHVDTVMGVVNSLPVQTRSTTDYSRVREWALDGLARNFRQTIVFAAYPFAELHALLRRTTANVSGAVRVYKAYDGSIGLVTSSVRQLFHRVPVSSTAEEPERRMEFFKKVYQQFRSNMATRVLVYVPSYFDFLRVRKFMTEVGTDVLYANEYTERGDLSFALAHFKNGNVEFLVYTERLHFHRRLLVRGAHHIIFYGPPHCAEFYPELVNCIDASAMGASCVLLFTKFDALELERIVGSQRQDRMATSDKPTFMFCT